MNKPDYYSRIEEAANTVLANLPKIPRTAIILGSGLGDFVDQLSDSISIPFSEIPCFPLSTVKGHEGILVGGYLAESYIIAMKGRLHYYEGHPIENVVFPIRLFQKIGIQNLILTNAAGGISSQLSEGSLMQIQDHISFGCPNPLIGSNDERFGTRFPAMNEVYSPEFQAILSQLASELSISLHSGIYAYTTGPSYETPAEISLLKQLGISAVGMSTVPEAIVAKHAGMKIAALSCITNMAAGIAKNHPTHEEVLEVALKVKNDFQILLFQFIQKIDKLYSRLL